MKNFIFYVAFILISCSFLTGCSAGSYLSDTGEAVISHGDDTGESGSDEAGSDDMGSEDAPGDDPGSTGSGILYVYVCGAVGKPGVYELPEGSRVYQALDAAGGLLEDADEQSVNQAVLLSDGDMIVIPYEGESSDTSGVGGSAPGDDGRVNINLADSDLLQTLPGIGAARAEAIIAYRDSHGPFSDIEGLRQVDGIGDGIYGRIADHICV